MNIDFLNLLYNYLEEQHYGNFYQNAMQDADYLKASQQEQELCSQYESLNLSDDQSKVILDWIDAITSAVKYSNQSISILFDISKLLMIKKSYHLVNIFL